MIPGWMPLTPEFWIVLTGIAFVLAGVAILAQVLDVLAARMLTAMLLLFDVLVLVRLPLASPHNHVAWGANAYNLAAAGAVWIFAESIARRRSDPALERTLDSTWSWPNQVHTVEISKNEAPAIDHSPASVSKFRIESIDLLRGLIMIVMALDHTRDLLGVPGVNPTDPAQTNIALFLTRWITHFCAPVFFLLTGTGAYLLLCKTSKRQLSGYLVRRGLWLILLELTIFRCFGFQFNFDYHVTFLNVLWALGWAMITLSALVYLPVPAYRDNRPRNDSRAQPA